MLIEAKEKLENVIKKYNDDLNNGIFDNMVYEAIKEDILDEMLDTFYAVEITIPPEIVTKQLYAFYIKRVVPKEEQARYTRKINFLINKHQNIIVKTLDAPSKK